MKGTQEEHGEFYASCEWEAQYKCCYDVSVVYRHHQRIKMIKLVNF